MARRRAPGAWTIAAWSGINNVEAPDHPVFQGGAGRDGSVPAAVVAASDVDLDNAGRFKRRQSVRSRLVLANPLGVWSVSGLLLAQDGVTLGRVTDLEGSPALSPLIALNAPTRVVVHQHANKILVAQGATRWRMTSAAAVLPWSMSVPGAPTLTPVAGTALPAGTYLCGVQVLDAHGVESALSPLAAITLDGTTALRVGLTGAVDAAATMVQVFLTRADGSRPLLSTAATVASFPVILTKEPAIDVAPPEPELLPPPDGITLMGSWAGFLLAAVGRYLWISDGARVALFNNKVFTLPSPILSIAGLSNGVWVTTEKGPCWLSCADNVLAWQINDPIPMPMAAGGAVVHTTQIRGLVGDAPPVEVALFVCEDGILVGWGDGSVTLPTRSSYRFPDCVGKTARFALHENAYRFHQLFVALV